jgi:hypothetical protein
MIQLQIAPVATRRSAPILEGLMASVVLLVWPAAEIRHLFEYRLADNAGSGLQGTFLRTVPVVKKF